MNAKERQAFREKFLRRYVRAKGLTAKEADRARKLSDQNILLEYGIRVPKRKRKLPPVKVPSKNAIARHKREREKFKFALELGWNPQIAATKIKRKPWKNLKEPELIVDPDPWSFDFGKSTLDQDVKEKRWRDWARKGNEYPERIKALAAQVNQLKGFDEHASYGWAVVYHAYVEDGNIQELMEILLPDLMDPDRYTDARLQNR